MNALFVGLIAAVVGGLVTWGLTMLPGFRQAREYKRQLHQTIVGVPSSPGVEARPALVDRVVGVETVVKEVGATVSEHARVVRETMPRVERQVTELQTSHNSLADTLRKHMTNEETAISEMRAESTISRAELAESVENIGETLAAHSEEDLRVAGELREELQAIATDAKANAAQATEHAAAARRAAEASAEASHEAAAMDRQVLERQTETHQSLAAISTAVGATELPPDPEQRRRRQR